MADDESQDDSQKTEDPTQRRLDDARKKGQVPMSREVGSWLLLFAGSIVVVGFGGDLMTNFAQFLKLYISESWQLHTSAGIKNVLGQSVLTTLGLLAFPFIIFIIAAIAGPLAQVGPMLAPDTLKFDLSKISPLKGIGRIFSMKSVVEFLKGLIKIFIVGGVAYMIIKPYGGRLESLISLPIPALMNQLQDLLIQLLTGILAVFFVIVAADVIYQRISFNNQMRMSRQDIKDEFKQTEGDPHIKSRLRNLRIEKTRQRIAQAVPQSTVVITNPTHFAVALRYNQGMDEAPVLVAKGLDYVALKIRELAMLHKVVIVENPPLARTLYKNVDIDQTIPEDQYKAVAEVISFVFRMQSKAKKP